MAEMITFRKNIITMGRGIPDFRGSMSHPEILAVHFYWSPGSFFSTKHEDAATIDA